MSSLALTPFKAGLFVGKSIIVTGGGTGLGYAIAKELVSLGAKVVIAARRIEVLEAAASEMNKSSQRGGKIYVCQCNVRNEDDIQKLVTFALETMGGIDGLVNNAGGQFVSPVENISARGFKAVVETNLLSCFMLSKEIYNRWWSQQEDRKRSGSIVNIILANKNGFPMMAHSGAARAGVENLTKSMALEWIGRGVRVNCVAPGIIYTESGFANYGEMAGAFLSSVLPCIPAHRCGTAEEVSSLVVFLLSDAAVYITGQNMGVDGGMGQGTIPLRPQDHGASLLPVYGELPMKARL
ncbi:peroxisomal trans-2-enoyl-CoA reductase [Nannochloropsis gaditana CCMP526]|nr:peroxisomal trans-2-enoyl-CoA reductase [Nannochloropsis gaditana CCMP526]EKU20746.1 peroxisomal trans-2-enoyl-CoA reductase [Nannochloropsis gaditana CCMP526]|eukprot:XP_005855615.1 peroxisomal trans-2-enoyl-CoA reductase [Nannochloropsis gaditana CCMP526]